MTSLIVPGEVEADLARWQEMGLEPVEVASEDAEQRITVTHNAVTGQVEWRTEKLDGVQALGLLAQTMWSMFPVLVKEPGRPKFSSGQARIGVFLDADKLTVGLDPLHDPTVVKGALAAALWDVIARSSDDAAGEWSRLFEVA